MYVYYIYMCMQVDGEMERNNVNGKRFVFIVCKYHGSSLLY